MAYLLTFQNTHYAIHGEKILSSKEIPISVMALPVKLGDFCGICLSIDSKNISKGLAYLQKAKVPIANIFKIVLRNNEKEYLPWTP